MKLLLLLSCFSFSLQAFAQPSGPAAYDPAQRYSVAQLQADFTYLRRALEEAHPALHWYTPQDSLDQAFARTAATLTHPMSEPAYWQLLQTLVARVHCGHTRVQHSAAYRAWFRRQPYPYLPFTVAVRQNRLFIAQNQSTAAELRPGTELLAIDGHPTAEVLPRLRSLISGDGYGTGFQDRELDIRSGRSTLRAMGKIKPGRLISRTAPGRGRLRGGSSARPPRARLPPKKQCWHSHT